MQLKSSVVLVHGEWADGSSWSKVIPLLQENGLRVTAVQLPLTSLADDVAVTRHVIALQEGSTVLAGHSYGGSVITEAGTNTRNVVGLVYVSAFAPDEGESLGDLYARQRRRVWRTSVLMTRVSCGSIPRHLPRHSRRTSIPSKPGSLPSCRNRSRQGFSAIKLPGLRGS